MCVSVQHTAVNSWAGDGGGGRVLLGVGVGWLLISVLFLMIVANGISFTTLLPFQETQRERQHKVTPLNVVTSAHIGSSEWTCSRRDTHTANKCERAQILDTRSWMMTRTNTQFRSVRRLAGFQVSTAVQYCMVSQAVVRVPLMVPQPLCSEKRP